MLFVQETTLQLSYVYKTIPSNLNGRKMHKFQKQLKIFNIEIVVRKYSQIPIF